MTFTTLALIVTVGIAGPLLALPRQWHLPVVLGELVAGILLGPTGSGTLHATDPSFTLLADVGFALVMFVAGSHVPVRDPAIIRSLRTGGLRAVGVAVVSIPLALAISHGFGTGHTALYAVLMSSSSAALILPIVDSLGLGGEAITAALPQIALADAACIVALPLAIDPSRAGRASLGALAVIACAAVLYVALSYVEKKGWRHRVHELSEERSFALELRISLAILFGLAAVATKTHVSIMLAGFSFGIAVAAVGEPRRLAKQLFAITEGFLGPLFFVWLGASLDIRALGSHPKFIALGVVLGLGAATTHTAMAVTKQPIAVAALCCAQLGVPVAAATLGTQLGLLANGQPAALILGALVTIAIATLSGGVLAPRTGSAAPPGPPQPQPRSTPSRSRSS
ncbi:MAG TPA: cation:proton antiporter [Mycobacteriales bacterium]|nr:cation:proton antiporter [Mycobacteriales bacterium]